ncbi:MAG: polysaccharide biosynthesis C-terminal domain-containing protein, partial [Bdellovibrionales bacterium]|nr:polysaccharide biosynthesis C-terminal domain-containing protein [Bdellovibrionales bacterium]
EDYLPAAPVLGILLLAQLFKVISAPTGYVMTMTGNERITSWVIGGAAVLNVILNVLLVPKYGLMGAGIATCISALCWNALLVLKVRRLFGVLLIPFLPERQR